MRRELYAALQCTVSDDITFLFSSFGNCRSEKRCIVIIILKDIQNYSTRIYEEQILLDSRRPYAVCLYLRQTALSICDVKFE